MRIIPFLIVICMAALQAQAKLGCRYRRITEWTDRELDIAVHKDRVSIINYALASTASRIVEAEKGEGNGLEKV